MANKFDGWSPSDNEKKKLIKRAMSINEKVVDTTKYITDAKDKEWEGTEKAPDATTVTNPKKGKGKGKGKGGTPPGGPTPPTPSAPAPGPSGGSGGGGGSLPIGGGHSDKTSRVRGIEDKFDGKYDIVDPFRWIRAGGAPATRAAVVSTPKWQQFESVYKILKKKLSDLQAEEITEEERHNIIGDDINMKDYIKGGAKYFDKVTVPEKETDEMNVILALDASGSTGHSRQYAMSGVVLATKKALEETGISHSLMVYSNSVSILDVDKVGRSNSANALAGNFQGSGGNDEAMVLDIASAIAIKNADKKNVIIIVSDGGVADVRDYIKKMKAKLVSNPVNVYCVGYGDDFDSEYATEIFGRGFAIGTKNNTDYSKKLVAILTKELENTLKGGH